MILFWVAAGVISAAAAFLMLGRAARAASIDAAAADPTPILYRRQLAEIDELAERGLMGEAERKSARAEAGRRLLSAAEAADPPWSADPAARRGVLATAIVAPLAALGVYFWLGSPGMADQPFAERMQAWKTQNPLQLEPAALAAVLKSLIAERPPNAEGYRILAMVENAAQSPAEAVRAARHAVALAPDRADVWETLGEALLVESGGQLTDAATDAFQETLKRDPKAIVARFQLARARIEAGDKSGGLAQWKALLADMPPNDDRRQALVAAIAEQEGAAPTATALPAGQMGAIRGMVEGLAQRLKANPDDPDGWVRLVRAYAVLGEAGKRDAALTEAKARYRTRPDVLQALDAAAQAEPMR